MSPCTKIALVFSQFGPYARAMTFIGSFCGSALSCQFLDSKRAFDLPDAQFGIFFGSQIQQRRDIPLEVDTAKQQLGFRILFGEQRKRPSNVAWDLDYPTKASGPRGPGNAPRAIRSGTASLPTGADRFEQRIAILPSDPIGTYSIRVTVDGLPVLDRPFRLVSPRVGLKSPKQ